ncbi:MAG TPA: GNAT family N-acetyltransferase [Gemmatimonadales bacterium]|nr:GNAT family N-acetyltransferase [Gemmatimonadales bacterium]
MTGGLTFSLAEEGEAEAIAALQTAVAEHLTARFGRGYWSSRTTARGVLGAMRQGRLVVGRMDGRPVAVACVGTRKPWAIDPAYFTPCARPVYLTNMAVAPEYQGKGIGRRCLGEAVEVARSWPGDAVRLDAYDAAAGAGPFYAKCGFDFRGRASYRGTPHLYYELLLDRTNLA